MPSTTRVTDRIQFPAIKLEGTDLTARDLDDLDTLRVERSLWMPSRATIRLSDPEFKVTDSGKFAIGKLLKISLPDITGSLAEVFDGEITDLTVEPGLDRRPQLVIGALDKGHRLSTSTNFRSFTKVKYSDIVSTVASGAGLTADVTATATVIPYVVQATNDHAFLWEIARRIGYDWWMEGSKLCFKPSTTTDGPTLKYGDTLVEFRVRYSGALKGEKITVQGWDPDTQAAVTGDDASALSGASMPDIGSDAALATEGRSKAKSAWAKPMKFGSFIATTSNEAKAIAQGLANQADAMEVTARGHALSTPTLVPGKKVKIENMGTKVSGKYYVTSVEHVFGEGPGISTRFTAGNKAPVGLADLLGGGQNPNPSWGSLGLVVGVVTNVKDEENNAGRVKVKFPTLSATDESAWARVAILGGGPETGMQFLPEVNDEVLVAFEQGDLRYPVVLGGVWSKKNKPATPQGDPKIVNRVIRSRAGHTITMMDGDSDDKKSVTILLADKKTTLALAHDKVTLEANSKPLTIKSGQASIEFDANGGITIKGQKVTIDAAQGVEVKSSGGDVKASGLNVTLAANAAFKATGNSGANLESSAIAVVKGTMVKIN
jgi:phage protein D